MCFHRNEYLDCQNGLIVGSRLAVIHDSFCCFWYRCKSYALLNVERNVYPIFVWEISLSPRLSHLLKLFLYYFLGQDILCLEEY